MSFNTSDDWRRIGENNLSFIETSALDASNVELAFQNILTGTPRWNSAQYLRLWTNVWIYSRNLPHRIQQGLGSGRRRPKPPRRTPPSRRNKQDSGHRDQAGMLLRTLSRNAVQTLEPKRNAPPFPSGCYVINHNVSYIFGQCNMEIWVVWFYFPGAVLNVAALYTISFFLSNRHREFETSNSLCRRLSIKQRGTIHEVMND